MTFQVPARRSLLASGLCLLLHFASPAHLRAEIVAQPSIDTLVAKADVICLGDVVSVETRLVRKGVWVQKVGLKVTKAIQKSIRGEALFFSYQVSRANLVGREWLFSRGGVLVLLRATKPDERLLHSSLTPVATRLPMTVIEPTRKDHDFFFGNDFKRIADGEQLVKAVGAARSRRLAFEKQARASNKPATIVFEKSEAPAESEVYKLLYADSEVSLIVPAYMKKRR